MEQDIKQLRKYYASLPDYELQHRITQNAHGLKPEAIEVIKQEAKKRGLSLNTEKSLNAQNKAVTNRQVQHYSALIQDLACPICNKRSQKTNAATIKTVVSFIAFSNRSENIYFGCPICLQTLLQKASSKTRLFGWWAIWRAPFMAAEALSFNADMRKRISKSQKPTVSLKRYIAGNIGSLESVDGNRMKILKMLKDDNQLSGLN